MSSNAAGHPTHINMTEKVHYEDNLFYLSLMVKLCEKSRQLDISPVFFHEKNLKDLLFLHQTLQRIYSELTVNKFLINRDQYLFSLLRVKMSYVKVCRDFMDHAERDNSELWHELKKSLEINDHDIADIRSSITNLDEDEVEKDLISQEEMNFLMAPDSDQED